MSAPLVQREPEGYVRTDGGIFAPTTVDRRQRKVMTDAQRRLHNRYCKDVLVPMGIRHIPVCADPNCSSPKIAITKSAGGVWNMDCGCTHRESSEAI